jgi:hypothetical protein
LRSVPPSSWKPFPPFSSPRAAQIARRIVGDFTSDVEVTEVLARICHEGAVQRYEELRADPEGLAILLSERPRRSK